MSSRRTILAWLCGLGVAAASGIAAASCGGGHGREHVSSNPSSTLSVLSAEVAPSPEHPPARVVAIQLEALRLNDEADRGIAVAFRFASPANKALTGPFPRFAFMIHNGPYRAMLDYVTAIYDPVVVSERKAVQRVTLVSRKGTYTYVFYLSRQTSGPCRDCWMTDAVTVEPLVSKRV